ncbi:hypothetical protein JVU11DRAFT_10346 [Chiua virens]|nr:hypothetical protein JVU11DRAFT_10346 [Chiua virens]
MQSRLRHTFSTAFFLVSIIFLVCATVAQGAALDARISIIVDAGKRKATNKDVEDVAGWFREYVHSKSKRETVTERSEVTEANDDMALGWFRAAKLSERELETDFNPPDDYAWFASADFAGSEEK